jgi:transcription elongation factor Elf1
LALVARGEWTDEEIERFNERATENYREKGMAECDNCGRKFFFEQMAKHRKNCELINGKLNAGKKLSESAPLRLAAKPKTITCVVCGREYGTSSILIHSLQCQELFTKQQALKPKEERKPMPSLSEADRA